MAQASRGKRPRSKATTAKTGKKPVFEIKLVQEWIAKLRWATETLIKDRYSSPFRKAVDASSLGAENYYNIIKNPMDLSTIAVRLVYSSLLMYHF